MSAGSRYSDQERRESIALYVLHGNWRRVSELTHIPERTLNDWSIQPWFATMLAELRAEKGAELDGVFTRIIHEATEHLLDRLKHGDPYVVGGEVRRKPVAARDLALVAAITYDKRALARNGSPPPPPEEEYLPGLAAYLEDFAKAKIAREKQTGR
jgi:hypothetical protein